MVRDFKLEDFWRIFVLSEAGGVGQTDKVLFALVNGLFSGRLVALLVAEGREKAMFRHLSRELGVVVVVVVDWS